MHNPLRSILPIFLLLIVNTLSASMITWRYHILSTSIENKIYFYHGDHLGSAHWITERHGIPIQYIHYLPYGEILANQHTTYNERFKFTGKELDAESGYYYFGARYLLSELGNFISSDPLTDKNLHLSSYMYCHGNPIRYIDPDGEDPRTGIPGYWNNGIWISAQNTTYRFSNEIIKPQKMPEFSYKKMLSQEAMKNQGVIRPTFTKESFLQKYSEHDQALITNPVIQGTALTIMSVGATSLAFDAAPTMINAGTDVSTFLNASLYPAVESNISLQTGVGLIEGVFKAITPGTDLAPSFYDSPAYQVGSGVGNIMGTYIIDYIRSSNNNNE